MPALLLISALLGLQDPDRLKRENRELQDQVKRLEQELERVKLENVKLKLAQNSDPELRLVLIRDEALKSPYHSLALFGLEEAGRITAGRFKELAGPVGALAQNAAPELAGRAVEVLSKFTELADVQTALQDAADHPNAGVRQRVAVALRTVPTPAALNVLVMLLGDGAVEVRKAAAVATAEHPGPVSGAALLDRVKIEPSADVLEKLIDGLGALAYAEAGPLLIGHLQSTQENLVFASINALGKIKSLEAETHLTPFLAPGRPEGIRLIAVQSVGRIDTAGGRRRLVELLASDPAVPVRKACAAALAASADPTLATGPLLEALLAEADASVSEAIWKTMLALTEKAPDAPIVLLETLVAKKRVAEATVLCGRLHDARLSEEKRKALQPMERAVADALFAAGSAKEALPHYRALAAGGPPEAAVAERVVECLRAAGDVEEALRFLRAEFKRARGENPDRWAVGELAATLSRDREDAFARARTMYDLLHPNPAAPPEEVRKRWKTAYDAAVADVRAALLSPNLEARNQALSSAGALRDAIILPLADWIVAENAGAEDLKIFLYVGNAITRTAYPAETVADPKKRADAARAWKAWHEAR